MTAKKKPVTNEPGINARPERLAIYIGDDDEPLATVSYHRLRGEVEVSMDEPVELEQDAIRSFLRAILDAVDQVTPYE